MNTRMSEAMKRRFRETVFGHFLDVMSHLCESNLLLSVAQHQIETGLPSIDGLFYQIGPNSLLFTPQQFCLITGLRFGRHDGWELAQSPTSFKRRIFGEVSKVSYESVCAIFNGDWSDYAVDDVVRICILVMIETVFKGTQTSATVDDLVLDLVDDFVVLNRFPWGSYFWEDLVKNINNMHLIQKRGTKGFSLKSCNWVFKVLVCMNYLLLIINFNKYLRYF